MWALHRLLWGAAPKLPVTTGSGGLTSAPLPTYLLLGLREPKQLRGLDQGDLSDPTFPRASFGWRISRFCLPFPWIRTTGTEGSFDSYLPYTSLLTVPTGIQIRPRPRNRHHSSCWQAPTQDPDSLPVVESLPDRLHPGSVSPLQCPTQNSSSLVTNQNSASCFLSGFLMEPESHLLPGYCFVSSNLQAVQAPTFAFMSPGGTCVVPAMSVHIPRVPDTPKATPLSQHSLGWASWPYCLGLPAPNPTVTRTRSFLSIPHRHCHITHAPSSPLQENPMTSKTSLSQTGSGRG